MVKINQESKKVQYAILKHFRKHKTWLLNFFHEWYLMQNMNQFMEKDILQTWLAKVSDHTHLIMLTPKQMLPRLPIALAQVNAGNTSEILLNEIQQIIYSMYQTKEITKKVYNNIMNSIKV